MEPGIEPEKELDDRNMHEGRKEEMERRQPNILSGRSRLDTTLIVPEGRSTEVQLSMNQNEGKENSRKKETGSPRKSVKGKKRGLNREIIKETRNFHKKEAEEKDESTERQGWYSSHQEGQGDHPTSRKSN